MKNYFENISSLKELRSQYKELLKKYHPDNENGSTAYNTNMYDWENDVALREVLQKIINFEGIEITIIGNWIWLDGNTYAHKEDLKAIGFRWSKQHKKWHWHNGEFKKYGKKKLSYIEIQNKYGSTKVYTEQRILLQQA